MGSRMTRPRAAAVAALLLAAAPAFAQEYAVESFTGGHTDPPQGAVSVLGPGQDDAVKEVTLPFEFPFFGRLQTRVTVSSNGWLAFGATTVTVSANPPLPSVAAPDAVVAPLWDDLTTGAGSVVHFTLGAAPTRVFVVAWRGVDTFSALSDDDLSFQVRLHEGTGVVEVVYAATGVWDGLSYTAGIEDPTGTVAFGAGSLANDLSGQPAADWRFTPKAVTVTGRLLRDRPVAGTTGLGPAVESGLPVAGADLVLVREDTAVAAARGVTADDGTFAVTVLGADAPATHAADVSASSPEVRVLDAGNAVYTHRFATGIPSTGATDLGTITLGASVDTTNATIRRALNVQQAVRRGIVRARDAAAFAVLGSNPPLAAETFPRLDARWAPGAAAAGGATSYVPATATVAASIHVHDGADNPDAWDDDVLLRETGVHVFATVSVLTAALPAHTWDTATTEDRAFVDGFAHWFACAVQGRTQFIDTRSATAATVRDLEAATPTPVRRPDVTGAVAASLWDLVDGAGETHDDFAGALGPSPSSFDDVLKSIDLDLNAPAAPPGIDDFFNVWRKAGPDADRVATARIFIRYGALPDDAREANDRAGEESPVAGPSARVDGLTLSPYNEDHFDVAFGGAGDQPLLVTVTQAATGATEFDVEVRAAGGAVVASGTNVGAAERRSVAVATPGPAAAGTYTVRVVWRAGGAASYALAFHEPLRVATASLPEWTAGLPFKQDFAAAGGVAPYTFAVSQSVPGLSLSEGGSRLGGTPTTEGTYDVGVAVTDASGTGSEAESGLVLTVHPPLFLPAFFGVRSGETIAADVGSGGTAPSWTIDTLPPPPIALAGGPTLRMTGAPATARAFVIGGSAADAVGASVVGASSQVVVADALPGGRAADVPAGTHFGYWFDAVAGSKVDLEFRFRGTGATPPVAALVDHVGRPVDVTGAARVDGRSVRIRGVVLPRSGTWYVVFVPRPTSPFVGDVRSDGGARSPKRFHGVASIVPADAVVDVPFDAVAGSKVRLLARSEQTPIRVRPSFFELLDPDGAAVELPPVRRRNGGRVVEIPSFGLGTSGRWTLRIAGDASGPVAYDLRITRPRKTPVRLF